MGPIKSPNLLAEKKFPLVVKGIPSELIVRFDATKDAPIHTYLQHGKRWGQDLIGVSQRFWKSSDLVILDIGAHIGTYSIQAAQHTYNKVIAIEASPDNFRILEANKRANNLKNLEIYNIAAARKLGELRFSGSGSGAHVTDKDDDVTVPAMPLDDILEKETQLDFVKLDIEGYEIEAIAGLDKTIKKFKPIFLFEVNGHTLNFFDKTPNDLLWAIERYGYSIFLVNQPMIPIKVTDPFPFGVVDCVAIPTERIKEVRGFSRADYLSPEEIEEMFKQTEEHGNEDIKNFVKIYKGKLGYGRMETVQA